MVLLPLGPLLRRAMATTIITPARTRSGAAARPFRRTLSGPATVRWVAMTTMLWLGRQRAERQPPQLQRRGLRGSSRCLRRIGPRALPLASLHRRTARRRGPQLLLLLLGRGAALLGLCCPLTLPSPITTISLTLPVPPNAHLSWLPFVFHRPRLSHSAFPRTAAAPRIATPFFPYPSPSPSARPPPPAPRPHPSPSRTRRRPRCGQRTRWRRC